MGDPPLIVGHNENVELETQSAEIKKELGARKEEVREMIEEMGKMGRDLATRTSHSKHNQRRLVFIKLTCGRCNRL